MPTDERIREILEARSDAPFTHPHDGLTRAPIAESPRGYRLDRYGAVIGRGDVAFERARSALMRFENYPVSFARVVPLREEFVPGLPFATSACHFGFASLHPCRVTFVEDAPHRFGFGLGTLPGHIGAGEECFRVTLDPADASVRYDVQAISRPAGVLGHLGAPVFRLFQSRFRRETVEAMRRAVASDAAQTPARASSPDECSADRAG